MKRFSLVLILLSLSYNLWAQGRIIIPRPPRDFKPGQVFLKEVSAQIDLTDGAGNITLEQTFYNQSNHRLEGEYLFPVPHDAQLHDFYLYINGKKTKGQLLENKQARQTYEQIVRSMRDPALLEYSDYNLFKARIFPVEPKQQRRIELSYAQVLKSDNGLYRFTLPIRQSGQGQIESFKMTLNLESKSTLANIYSPSHKIEVKRTGKRKAVITLDTQHLEGNKDFLLYYSLADQEINSSLLTFRPRTDRDGYFMFMASPDFSIKQTKTIAKDIIFVVDVSGSMGGEKIKQARNALRFCLNTLNAEDRFEIISFSSGINAFQTELKSAESEQLDNARYFVSNLSANGGTNINEALQRALQMKSQDDQRPTSIVFLTDGLPTEGEQNIGRILQNVQDAQKDFVRIFSFGVGYDVNTFLLDKLSQDSHGSANYVKQGENIETEVSSFFAKISTPVLTDPQLEFKGMQVYDIYPQKLPDIFKGQRVTIFGRYRKSGKTSIVLNGKQAEKNRRYSYSAEFKPRESNNAFIAKLWANRKVSHLLTQIRFNGENPELVESVKALGMEYGIVTPYTSYLVTEQKKELELVQNLAEAGTASSRRMEARQRARTSQFTADEELVGSGASFSAMTAQPQKAAASSGKGAVMSSRIMKKIAASEKEQDMLLTIQRLAGKTFQLKNGIWIEDGIGDIEKVDVEIKFLSDAYFKLSKTHPKLNRILALGEKVVFKWQDKTFRIN